ncbi:MAG: hypothetical protein EXX96DRAFT_537194 [Benjaminiella poitrasii]|nr:MAG: hypothetical protein EXX96DRAFT_537194 [Benjaminiella poitrasii]
MYFMRMHVQNNNIDKANITKVNEICNILEDKLPCPPIIENLKANPLSFLPVLATMPRKLEKIAKERPDNDKPRLFSLVPTPSMHWRHLTINEKALASNTAEKDLLSYDNSLRV